MNYKKIKFISIFFLFSFNFFNLYPSTPGPISSCQTLDTPGVYTLTDNVTAGICFTITSNDVYLNCDDYTITPTSVGVYMTSSYNNLSVANCNIKGNQAFSVYGFYLVPVSGTSNYNLIENISFSNVIFQGLQIEKTDDSTFRNINLYNTTSRGIYLSQSDYNNFSNLYLRNISTYGATIRFSGNNKFDNFTIIGDSTSTGIIYTISSNNNIFNNITFYNLSIGIDLFDGAFSNYLNNSYIDESVIIPINFNAYFTGFLNNTFSNSYLGNFSAITSYNWTDTPSLFYDNTFLSGTVPSNECFDNLNLTCNIPYPVISLAIPTQNSAFPIQGLFSIMLSLFLIGLFLR